jgi:hypothetical protein
MHYVSVFLFSFEDMAVAHSTDGQWFFETALQAIRTNVTIAVFVCAICFHSLCPVRWTFDMTLSTSPE